MDLITGLPKHNGKDAILTIVDHRCSRAAVFLPCDTTITGPGIAQLYLDHVYKWYGFPNKVISDRDLLHVALRTKPHQEAGDPTKPIIGLPPPNRWYL
jgi:hypothetical protein